ncbi:MAG: aldo/keto reductase [Gammaproteobacteria bacterium]|nr:aldo/keto reductase [Gammaproteobacteria bacterium]MDE0366181.1 aldo/keto reductase [Gammaproteobacteria bacterium]
METVSFGNTGLKVSRLCFGTMTIGSSRWKPWVLDEAASRPLLKQCLDLGITFYDTANWYSTGESERIVASTLTSMVPRDSLVLATKAFYAMSGDPNDRGLSRKHLLASVDASLRRMNTDYIDLLVIHAFDPETPMEETMEALHDLVRSGKVLYLGASTMFAWQFAQMNHVARLNGWTQFVNMQCQYNLLYREEEREMLPYCRDRGIAVTGFSVLARGQLSASDRIRSRTDEHFSNMYGDALDREICARVAAVAAERNTTMAAVALAWVLAREDICCPIIGASTPGQVENNVRALDLELTAEEIDGLSAMYRPRDVINDYVPEPMPRYWQGVSDDAQ